MKKVLLYQFLVLFLFLNTGNNKAFAQYALNGDATQNGNCFLLTPDQLWKSSSVWYLDKVDISQRFELYFDAYFGCKDFNGADGMAFVLQQVSTSVGSQGEGIGYLGIAPSLAIEFDTHSNGNRGDPFYDHIAVMKNGVVNHTAPENLAGPVPILGSSTNAEDCNWHDLKITWSPDSMLLKVFVDCQLKLLYTGDIISTIFNGDSKVFWGFTSATGGYSNRHEFCFDFVSFQEKLSDTAICRGGSVPLNVGSGDVFTWTPAAGLSASNIADPIASPDSTTTYFVEIIDDCNIPRYDTVTIYVQDSLDKALNDDYRLCPDGEALIVPDYPFASFLWHDGSTADTLSVSQPGTFVVQVTNLCSTFPDTFAVLPALFPSLQLTDVSCHGGANGSASLTLPFPSQTSIFWGDPQGAPVQITLPGASSSIADRLEAGSYFYLTRDSVGCVLADSFVIQEPTDLQLFNPISQDVTCGGQASGQLSATTMGGIPPYSYSLNGNPFQANPLFSNLPAGNYVLVVRDNNQCEESLTIVINQNPPLSLTLDSTLANPCFGDSLGKAFVSARGGVGLLEFSIDQRPFQPQPLLSNLSAGPHTVVVRDSLGCTNSINISIDQPSPLVPTVAFQRNIGCFGNHTGEALLAVSGGTAPYEFAFNQGTFAAVDSFFALAAGTYPYQVKDDSGCITMDSLQITEPPILDGLISQLIDVACFGDSSGYVILRGIGGSGNYQFGINPGPTSSDSIIRSLSLGTYTFVIQDDSSCTDTVQGFVDQPLPLEASLSNLMGVDCIGNQSGGMEIQGSGGTVPYLFAVVNSGNVGTGFGVNNVFDSLYAGIYTGQVMDANGCLAAVDTFIPTPTNLIGGIDTLMDVDCFGNSNGSILMTTSGGTAPYGYSFDGVNYATGPFFGGLPSMQDTVIIRDANGCLIPVPFIINQPDSLNLDVVRTRDISCFGTNDGEIALDFSGGILPVSYRLNGTNPVPDSLFTNLSAGNYNFQLEDANGCMAFTDTVLTEPDSLVLLVDSLIAVACFGESNGSIEVSAMGGAGSFSYAFVDSSFSNLQTFDSLGVGSYLVQVMDDSSCITQQQITISQPDSLVLGLLEKTDILCHDETTGQILLQTNGGNSAFIYAISGFPNQPSSMFDSLGAGNYLMEVRDEKGCYDSLSIILTQAEDLIGTLGEQVNVDCYGNANASLSVAVDGGVMPYGYSLNGASMGNDSIFSNLNPGRYDIEIQDANGCREKLDSLMVTQPDSLVATLNATDVACHGEASGSLLADVRGGTLPYSYLWKEFPDTEGDLLDGITEGEYFFEVIDENGCVDSAQAIISQPDTLVMVLDSLQEAYCDLPNGYASISASGGMGSYSFVWIGPSTYRGAEQTGIEGGRFLTRVVDENGCADTLRVIVPQDPPATPFFITDPPIDQPILLSQANEINFVNQSENAVDYLWDMDDAMGLFNTEDVTFSYTREGNYVISLTAYNKYFICPTTYTDTLTIIPDGNLEIANAFTPNGDGTNDEYFLVGRGVVSLSFIIFNQWGKEVYTFNSLADRWNGKNRNGIRQSEGVYVYRLKAIFNSGEMMEKSGTITLIR